MGAVEDESREGRVRDGRTRGRALELGQCDWGMTSIRPLLG